MKVYLTRQKNNIFAIGEFDPDTKKLTVRKGSQVSDFVAHSEKFRGAETIEKNRKKAVQNGIVVEEISFKSPSTAANFVTGSSTNGLIAWKDEKGRTLKKIIEEASE